jgi:hypothetical protein
MIVNITFNLEDHEDSMAHFRALKAMDMAIALSDIAEDLRQLAKYGGDEVHQDTIAMVRAKFYAVLEDNHIDLDELLM